MQIKIKKAIVYVRISTEKQLSNTSIEQQILAIKEFCQENGITIVTIYIEEGSAKSIEGRPEFIKMYNQFIGNEDVNCLIVYKLDRAFRNFLDSIFFWNKLGDVNKHFISIADNINTQNPDSKTSYYINAYLAEKERDNILLRTSNGMKAKAEKGYFNGGVVFGYESVSKKLRIVPSEAAVVEYIFKRYSYDAWGYKKIASELNLQGIKTKHNKEWTITAVKTILENRIYIGEIKWSNEYRKGKHKSIISQELWDKAQELRKEKSYTPEKIHPGSYPLSGLIKCPQCGSPMVQGNSSQKYKYYQCNRNKSSGKSACSSNLVSKEYAEEYVFNQILSVFNGMELSSILFQLTITNLDSVLVSLDDEIRALNKSLKLADKRITDLYNLTHSKDPNKKISEETFILLTNEIELEKVNTNQKLLDLEERVAVKNSLNLERNIDFTINNFTLFYDIISNNDKKALFHSIIKEVHVTLGTSPKGRKIKEIIYKFNEEDIKNSVAAS
ncbi:hypothetical protein A2U94_05450 [Bacillus sp. VT 712]|uniref:recombinase family protein n=1 Tax=Bacillaceae TaxID=186817 RepID=UPI000473DFB2|nr:MULTISPECIES: recombinase family protein [Bacillaceae]KZB92461.1 hypothetical protein A2U94_05450 [Bacillus sp. VT 712]